MPVRNSTVGNKIITVNSIVCFLGCGRHLNGSTCASRQQTTKTRYIRRTHSTHIMYSVLCIKFWWAYERPTLSKSFLCMDESSWNVVPQKSGFSWSDLNVTVDYDWLYLYAEAEGSDSGVLLLYTSLGVSANPPNAAVRINMLLLRADYDLAVPVLNESEGVDFGISISNPYFKGWGCRISSEIV